MRVDEPRAFRASRVWTLCAPDALLDHAVVVRSGQIERIVPVGEVGAHIPVTDLGDVDLAPGFVDVQVNGGGGALFNDDPTVRTVRTIAEAHRRFGTTTLLPTFITDSAPKMLLAGQAVREAIEEKAPGVRGIHFEGPFLDDRKTGAHDKAFVRSATDADLAAILGASAGALVVTAAVSRLGGGVLEALVSGGARVALGHCASAYEDAVDAFERGVTGVTHLYNAMSPLEGRAPGLVGAALATEGVFAGVIVDGVHVNFGSVRAAYHALGTRRMMLVTDAVQPVGVELDTFALGGQVVRLEGGRCINEEGNLAGSALDMATAVRNAVQGVGISLGEALSMASKTPACFAGLDGEVGTLETGKCADLVALDRDQRVTAVVQSGDLV